MMNSSILSTIQLSINLVTFGLPGFWPWMGLVGCGLGFSGDLWTLVLDGLGEAILQVSRAALASARNSLKSSCIQELREPWLSE